MKRMIQTLKYLIRQKTITEDKTKNHEVLKWIEKKLVSKFQTKILHKKGFYSLIATTQKTKHPKVWLAAHLDVVPGSNEIFIPKEEKGKIIGRGAFDMKFAIACFLKLVEEIKDIQAYNFGIMVTSDEEIGGQNGVKFLLNEQYRSELVFLPDGCTGESIEREAKGVWHIEAEARGVSTHASRPWAGKNAIQKLIHFLYELEKHTRSESCEDKIHHHNTLNIGKIRGGEAINKVPHKAVAELDIRHIPETSEKEIKTLVRKIAKKHRVEIREIVYARPTITNFEDTKIKLYEKIYKEQTGKRLKRTLSHGSSDARFFHEKGIPVILAQPKGGGHHTEYEWVDIQGLESYYQVLKKWLLTIS
ncbi:MAG: M20/M25/M40 family metallo-hydrolase [Nanoarchaeota archaeon]|nr:M20/M25/M40 family metallo-hydrolase [Nanoarchaeota archaeon]